MSLTPLTPEVLAPGVPPAGVAPRRVRQQARDAVVLMAFSAAVSVTIASGFLLLAQLGH